MHHSIIKRISNFNTMYSTSCNLQVIFTHPLNAQVCQLSILSRFDFYSYSMGQLWYSLMSFNPIKVRFLPFKLDHWCTMIYSFNPIKVRFLRKWCKCSLSNVAYFQSYQGSIFTCYFFERLFGVPTFNPIKVRFLPHTSRTS